METTIIDPWKNISLPTHTTKINAKRVDANIPWDFFWARSIDNNYLLILKYNIKSMPSIHLPKLKGINIKISCNHDNEKALIINLIEFEQKDLFYKLCCDIVMSASVAKTEREAVEITISRTWRWHYLLRGGSLDLLSLEEQKGLIGELLFLERFMLVNINSFDAVTSWVGPFGNPKDFEVGKLCVEVKTKKCSATPYVTISSEYQLDMTGLDGLYLYVVELTQVPSNSKQGFTVTDLAARIKNSRNLSDENSRMLYEDKLYATGFSWDDDYSDTVWVETCGRLYHVTGNFPHIGLSQIKAGVSNVKYKLSLATCEEYLINDDVLHSILGNLYVN